MTSIGVIGSGFSGLSAACCLADAGYRVTVIEKNDTPGGRARKFSDSGFTFDMGPSWYWMPDVFERFFSRFGASAADYYELVRLDPSYRVFTGDGHNWDVPADKAALQELFESIEAGSGKRLAKFLDEARQKYHLAIDTLLFNPGLSLTELMRPELVTGTLRFDVFRSMTQHIRRYFRNPLLVQLLEFPVLFLGAAPWRTPSLYSLMNYADLEMGTWYPMGGMYRIIEGMVSLAKSLGVDIRYDEEVRKIEVDGNAVKNLQTGKGSYPFDAVVASADYHHVEQELLPETVRRYSDKYWESRTLAPSALLFYLGVEGRVDHLLHHNLFFDQDLRTHVHELYDSPQWPSLPLFYVGCPSKTDPSVAPAGMENLFILIPVAPGLSDEDTIRERYFEMVLNRILARTKADLRNRILYKRSYAHRDFIRDYHAYKGNAYGLANTLRQTANLKPSIVNKHLRNLFYTGQLTVPGPGIPPALISGQVVAAEVVKRIPVNELVKV